MAVSERQTIVDRDFVFETDSERKARKIVDGIQGRSLERAIDVGDEARIERIKQLAARKMDEHIARRIEVVTKEVDFPQSYFADGSGQVERMPGFVVNPHEQFKIEGAVPIVLTPQGLRKREYLATGQLPEGTHASGAHLKKLTPDETLKYGAKALRELNEFLPLGQRK